MRTGRLDRMRLFALAALFGSACASDLDLSLAGRPCLNGACLSGFECVQDVCVAQSSSIDDGVAMADSGGLIVGKDSGLLFPGSGWVGNEVTDADGSVIEDAGVVQVEPPPLIDAGPIGGTGGTGGVQATGGTGGVQATGGTGGVEPPPPPPCPPEEMCNGACVDLSSDAMHCGHCDHACASVELCIEGECRAECEPEGGLVIDVDLDLDGDADEECPEACDACVEGTCEIHCEGEQACKERKVECPEGYACIASCNGVQACEKLELNCADGRLCSLRCDGEQACKEAKVECGGSYCEALCVSGTNACEKTQLNCGTGPCNAVCGAGQRKPTINDCMRSCSSGCGCEEP